MEITGRVTANATVRETKNSKKVVGFSLAINDTYSKDGERQKVTTYVDCAYWRNASIAQYLGKGTLVQLSGRIGAKGWTDREGKARANLTFHINEVKFLGKTNVAGTERVTGDAQSTATTYNDNNNTKDDLPF